jgi:hypothetical protein
VIYGGNIVAVVIVGIVYAIEAWQYNANHYSEPNYSSDEVAILGSRMLVGVFQLISFSFLAVGTLAIRKYIVSNNNIRNEMNTRILLFHVLTLLFYVATGLGFYVSEVFYFLDEDAETSKTVLVTVSCC